jgi:hypothetical protein
MAMQQIPTGARSTTEVRQLTNREYHADCTAVSSTMLNCFLRNRELYYRRYVAQTEPPRVETRQTRLGSALHMLLLEPELAQREIIDIPTWALSKCGMRAGNRWKVFTAAHAGRLLITADERRMLDAMLHSARRVAADWLAGPGVAEMSLYWTDDETGLRCKLRIDWLIECDDGNPLIIDVKTSHDATPEGFAESYRLYGYGIQEVHYRAGMRQRTGRQPHTRFLVVQNRPPHVAKIFASSPAEYDTQARRWQHAMRELAHCYRTNDWSPTHD